MHFDQLNREKASSLDSWDTLDIVHNDVVTVTSNVDQHCPFPVVVT